MSDTSPNLTITAGRVFCVATDLDGPGGVEVRGGKIVASGPNVTRCGDDSLDFRDGLLIPGLVDLHAHPGLPTWRFAIDPDVEILPRGTTTILSQGDAGAETWPIFREKFIEGAQTRVKLAISPSVKGELEDRGVFINLHEVDVEACVSTIEEGGEDIWGLAANLTTKACGDNDPREVMRRTLEIAERTGRPILYGPRREPSDWPLAEQLKLLRPGDVVTYCFHDDAESIIAGGRVVESAWEARERGVLFDVGHGKGTDDMGVGPDAIADGFLPDTISSDVYNNHLGWDPPHDLARTVSRMIAIGVPETEALARATQRPAEVLGLAGQVGTLAPGADGDLTVLRWSDPVHLAMVNGESRSGPCLEPVLTVKAGRIVGR